jgi:UDP-glucuronate 4-epimerase
VRILVTGVAGFIGYHLSLSLLRDGHDVVGVDALTDYYNVGLKRCRLDELTKNTPKQPRIENLDISEPDALDHLKLGPLDAVIHLAAQPGVRLPQDQFHRYLSHNLQATGNVLDFAQRTGVSAVLYASSSSVYGDTARLPFTESERLLSPNSLYGSTKLATEVLASGFARSTGLRTRGMRFFTVYGPMGRPDMAYFRLVAAALGEWEFELTGDGSIRRDFTYVDDTVLSVNLLLDDLLSRPEGFSDLVNVGGGQSRSMRELIDAVQSATGHEVSYGATDNIAADMAATEADFTYLESLTSQKPKIALEDGIREVVRWASLPDNRSQLRAWISSGGTS